MSQVTVTGMVLTAMPIGEYDKRLVILTKERGKITAFAKGARRQNSALLACSQPFTFGEFTVYEGKSSYNMVAANVHNYFVELREDLERIYYGFYFCEFCEYFTKENMDGTDVLKLLYQSLRALTRKTIPLELIRYVFELKLMTINGEAPQVFECVKCKTEDAYYFSSISGGLVCDTCRRTCSDIIRVSGSTIYTMQYIVTSSIEKLYTFTVADEVLKELRNCIKRYIKCYVDKEFKSLEVLEKL
ncbi:hypothetical protein bsdtb5_36060 [Anaeromicropila herbilytica]|uniref:DNA repair protein RecO n=1 Tax=Anaeromicropila herbilytica TaxID=2785025 RepID=A0A7R7EPC2_9FIRM|nr:hypothetical protein bsdtb5_36060 [Anaeromicropila herbilytica]